LGGTIPLGSKIQSDGDCNHFDLVKSPTQTGDFTDSDDIVY